MTRTPCWYGHSPLRCLYCDELRIFTKTFDVFRIFISDPVSRDEFHGARLCYRNQRDSVVMLSLDENYIHDLTNLAW